MIELTPREFPPSLPSKVGNSFFKGVRIAKDNIIWGVPLIAFEAGSAQPGEQLPTFTGRLAGLAAQPIMSGIASAGLTATLGLPPAAAAIAGMVLAAYVGTKLEDKAIRGFKYLTQVGRQSRRVAFGGDYEDTLTAARRRSRAMQELAGALPNARQWIGQEALILHR
jgi:hypothetical protein